MSILTVGALEGTWLGFREGDWLGLDEGCKTKEVKREDTRRVSECTVKIRDIFKSRDRLNTAHI